MSMTHKLASMQSLTGRVIGEVSDKRYYYFRAAIIASIASKAVRLISQILVVGVATRYVGGETYGVWMTLVAALSWLSWGQAGLAPGLVNAITAANTVEKKHLQAVYFTTALTLICAIALIIFSIMSYLYLNSIYVKESILSLTFGKASPASNDVSPIFLVCLGLAAFRLPAGLIEASYLGLQRMHIYRCCDIVAQLICIACAFALASLSAPIAWFVFGVTLSGDAGSILAGLYLLTRLRPDFLPSLAKFDLSKSTGLFGLSFGYFLLQVAGYFVMQAGIVMLARWTGSVAVSQFSVVWQFYMMAAGIWTMFITGLWGALGEAAAQNEKAWIRTAKKRLIALSMALSSSFCIMLALAGPVVVERWTGDQVRVDQNFVIVMAAYCLVFTWSVVHAQILSALSVVWPQTAPALTNGILVLIFGRLFIPNYGVTGLAWALLLSTLLSTAWLYPLLLNRETR